MPIPIRRATYQFTDDLSAILGARATMKLAVCTATYFGGFFTRPAQRLGAGRRRRSSALRRASPCATRSARTDVYFTYSQRLKSGLFNASAVPVTPSTKAPELVEPEKLDSYEIGIKSAPASWYSFSAATFLYKYKNQQEASGRLVNGVPLAFDQNAGKSTIYGADLEGKVKPVPELTLSTGISLLHSRIVNFKRFTINVPAPGNYGTVFGCDGVTVIKKHKVRCHRNYPRAKMDGYLRGRTPEVCIGTANLTANGSHAQKLCVHSECLFSGSAYGCRRSGVISTPHTHLTLTAFGRKMTNNAVISGYYLGGGGHCIVGAASGRSGAPSVTISECDTKRT
jgi:hypothetical protein